MTNFEIDHILRAFRYNSRLCNSRGLYCCNIIERTVVATDNSFTDVIITFNATDVE